MSEEEKLLPPLATTYLNPQDLADVVKWLPGNRDLIHEDMQLSDADLAVIDKIRAEGLGKRKLDVPEGSVVFDEGCTIRLTNWETSQSVKDAFVEPSKDPVIITMSMLDGPDLRTIFPRVKVVCDNMDDPVIPPRMNMHNMAYEDTQLTQEEADELNLIMQNGLARPAFPITVDHIIIVDDPVIPPPMDDSTKAGLLNVHDKYSRDTLADRVAEWSRDNPDTTEE